MEWEDIPPTATSEFCRLTLKYCQSFNARRAQDAPLVITRIETVSNDARYAFLFEKANVGGDTMAESISLPLLKARKR